LVLLLASSVAWAQTAGGYSAEPSKSAPNFETIVSAPKSPFQTQTRQFAGTRFWLLDPGRYEVELWWDNKFQRDHTQEGLLQLEIEIGLAPHLQLDIYQNFTTGTGGFNTEGNQIELRYAFGSYYNQILLNPVLYLEWHPRYNAQDRAEVRLLLGGDVPGRGLWAANIFFESNVDRFHGASAVGTDMEIGASAGTNFALVGDYLRGGAEVRLGVDQHGTSTFWAMGMAGPNLVLQAPKQQLKLTATAFFGFFAHDPLVRLLLIAGWQF
jgi:hypothetical protein